MSNEEMFYTFIQSETKKYEEEGMISIKNIKVPPFSKELNEKFEVMLKNIENFSPNVFLNKWKLIFNMSKEEDKTPEKIEKKKTEL